MKTICWVTLAFLLFLAGCAGETGQLRNYPGQVPGGPSGFGSDAACSPGCAPGQPSGW
jgi:hypothetical protein